MNAAFLTPSGRRLTGAASRPWRRAVCGGVILALGLLVPAAADEPAPRRSSKQEEIEVRAAAPQIDEIAAFGVSVPVEEAAERAIDLQDLLRRVPGVRVTSYGGLGRYATVSIRGSAADQVTVLVDGVPQNRALGGPVDISAIPASQIAGLVVFRGFAPAFGGLDGLGGVIDIRTRAPRPGAESLRLDVLEGGLGTRRLAGGWSHGLPGGRALRFGAEWLDSDGEFGYLTDNGTLATTADDYWRRRKNNGVRTMQLTAGLDLGPFAGGRGQLTLRHLGRRSGLPGTDSLVAERARLEEDHWDLSGSWARPETADRPGLELLVDGLAAIDHLRDELGELGFGASSRRTATQGGGVAWLVRRSVAGHGLLGRFDLRVEQARVKDSRLAVTDLGGLRRRRVSAVVEDRWAVSPRLLVAPSLRLERRRDDPLGRSRPGQTPEGPFSEGEWAAKVATAYLQPSGWEWKGSAGRFVHLPSLTELFGDRGAVLGNPSLRPESAYKAEAGAAYGGRVGGRRMRVEASVFASRSEDLIVFLPISFGQVRAQNLARATNRGIEVQVRGRVSSRLSLDASVSLQHLRDRSGGVGDGHRVPGRPDRQGYLGLRWKRKTWGVDYDLTYVGKNSSDPLDRPALRLPARVLHDLRIGRDLPGGWSMHLEVQNLGDQHARDVARFPLPGRTLYLHLGWRYGEAAR